MLAETTVRKTYPGDRSRPTPSGMARYSKAKVEPTNPIAREGDTLNIMAKSNGSIMMRRQATATTLNILPDLCSKKLSSLH